MIAVCVPYATIGGVLGCVDGHFSNTNGRALALQGAEVKGSANLSYGFEANGTVDFSFAHVAGVLQWGAIKSPENVILDLRSLKIGTLNDDGKSWPKQGGLFLNGFVYDEFYDPTKADAENRIAWLHLQPKDQFFAQPYEQLAAVFRKMGEEHDAAKVMIAKNEDYARRLNWYSISRLWYNFIGWLAGYGYLPGRAFGFSLSFVALGAFLFRRGYLRGLVLPADNKEQPVGSKHRPKSDLKFNAFVFSLETFVPLLELDVAKHWRAKDGSILRAYFYFHRIFGWILTTLWIGALTGLLKT